MSELTVKHLYANGAEEVIVANRTLARAEELASKFKGTPCTMEQALGRLQEVDILISSTGAKDYVLDRAQVSESMKNASPARCSLSISRFRGTLIRPLPISTMSSCTILTTWKGSWKATWKCGRPKRPKSK